MANCVGIDVGLVLHSPTSGLCRTGTCGFQVTHSFIDKISRQVALEVPDLIDVLAIDGPVLPCGHLDYEVRPVEKALLWGPFQRRCAVGETRRGIGAALRRGGCDTALQFAERTSGSGTTTDYPQIQAGLHVVEAFPNAFLGVMLSDSDYPNPMPRLKRGGKFEWLLERARDGQFLRRLRDELGWDEPALWSELHSNTHHEEQAGLICALSAVCVHRNRYVAVGEPIGGYIFLPPWDLWAEWARKAVAKNRQDKRLTRSVDVWIDGYCYASGQDLPWADDSVINRS